MARIGVFDSGVGGLSVLNELLKALPDEDYVYYADSLYCPYGGKSADYVVSRAVSITDTLVAEGCGLIVVACNTATSAAISFLREKYPLPFVGMEPAVKPAALETVTGVVGVLATAGTLSGSKYLDMKGKYSSGVKVVEHIGSGFVEIVERMAASGRELDPSEELDILDTIRASLKPLIDAGADSIVLGCTHYPFLLPQLEKVAAELCPQRHIHFINPAPAIARRVMDLIHHGVISDPSTNPGISVNKEESTNYAAGKTKPEPCVKLLSSGSVENLVTAFNHLCRR